MEIFKDFGVSPILLIAQIINFLIILYILKRFMYKPVLDVLKKREDQIRSGLKSAEEGEKKLIDSQEKEKQILQKARTTADKMVANAKLEAEELKAEKLAQTKLETEKMLELARLTIENETRDAEERLTQKIGRISVALLEKSLTGIFSEKEQSAILKKATDQIQKNT